MSDTSDTVVEWLFGDVKTRMRETINAIKSVPDADISTAAVTVTELYEKSYALIIVVALLAMMVRVLYNLFSMSQSDSLATPFTGILKVFFFGMLLPAAIQVARTFSQKLTDLFAGFVGPSESWQDAYTGDRTYADGLAQVIYGGIDWLCRQLLQLQTEVLKASVPTLMILVFVSLSITILFQNRIGKIARWFLSFLISAIFLQPAILFVLGLGGKIVLGSSISDSNKNSLALFTEVVACGLIVFLWWATNKTIRSVVTNPVQVGGHVDADVRKQEADTAMKEESESRQTILQGAPETRTVSTGASNGGSTGKTSGKSSGSSGGKSGSSGTSKAIDVGIAVGTKINPAVGTAAAVAKQIAFTKH